MASSVCAEYSHDEVAYSLGARVKTPPFLGSAPILGAVADFGSDRLDCLVADTVSNLQRLAELDASSVTAADLASELRDNLYPSLLTVVEELRELDGYVGELSAPEPSLAPDDALAIAHAFRSAQTLAASVRQTLPSIEREDVREMLREQARDVDKAVSAAAALVHRLVVIESPDDKTLPSGALTDDLEVHSEAHPDTETL